jgi:N-acetylneuraminic acid mutarotase
MSVLTRNRIIFFACALVAIAQAALAADPGDRTQTRMVYDAHTARTVLFGGATATDAATQIAYDLADTWEWTGYQWVQRFPAHVPPGRSLHAMTYDSTRSRVVVFGGKSGKTQLNDTWVYDGADWTQIDTPTAPAARALSSAAYDSLRDRVVLFGGSILAADGKTLTPTYDTWEFDGKSWTQVQQTGPTLAKPVVTWDGTRVLMVGLNASSNTLMYAWDPSSSSWVQLTPATLPDCVNEAGMVYQSHNDRVVLFGGICTSSTLAGDTWEWDGTTWSKVTTVNAPDRLSGEAMAYDFSRQQVLVYGGTSALGTARGVTMTYKDLTWNDFHDPSSPSSRSLFIFQPDPNANGIWMFGGLDAENTLGDFWQYSNGLWSEKVLLTNLPTSCVTPTSALDTDRSRMVVVCADSATFEFDGTSWTTMSPKNSPPYRRFSSMVYDPVIKKTVLFGGYNDVNYVDETWVWDGTNWSRQTNNPPTARELPAMWFDPLMKKTVVYGGLGRVSSLDRLERYSDMWSFDGSGWTAMKSVTATPGQRYGAQYTVDPASGTLLLFGGIRLDTNGQLQAQVYANDMWQWDGGKQAWAQLNPANPPTGRENGRMGFDPSRNTIVLFAGFTGHFLSDTWTYDRIKNSWTSLVENVGPVQNPTVPRQRAIRSH